jgi:hypothetical protein
MPPQSESEKRERAKRPEEVEGDDPGDESGTAYGGVIPTEEPEYEEPEEHEDADVEKQERSTD